MAVDLSMLEGVRDDIAGVSKPNEQPSGKALELPLTVIDEDPNQPRTEFDPVKLEELADSIKQVGVIQPITVKPHPELPDRYVICMGARRYRASKLAGMKAIPVLIAKEGNEKQADYAQVIENEQRDNLTPQDIAAFIQKRLATGDSKKEIAEGLGKRKEFITHHLALVDPPSFIEALWAEGKTSNPQSVYRLRNLHEKHPEAVEAWCNQQTEISPQAISLFASELGGNAKQPTASQDAPEAHSALQPTQAATKGMKDAENASSEAEEPRPRAEAIPIRRDMGPKLLTLEVPAKFDALVKARSLTPEQVLAAFMADLAHTEHSNGSDERRLAQDWFDRVVWPEPADESAVG